MLVEAMTVGVSEAEFWSMSPRQYLNRMKAEGRRAKQRQDDRKELAWWTENMARHKRLPNLQDLLADKTSRTLSVEDGFEELRARKKAVNLPKITQEEWLRRNAK